MPELPEVETVRRHMEALLVGKSVVSVRCDLPKLLRDSPIADLDQLVGRTLEQVRRRAKVLILQFSGNLALLMHLKLSGQVAIVSPDGARVVAGHPVPLPTGDYPHRATHVQFDFDDGTIAYVSDIRQFGWLRLMPSADVDDAIASFGFGPEGTETLDHRLLGAVMQRRSIPIKTLLLDQSFIAGLGNIYVDEVLFRAKVHPSRGASSLSARQRRAILEAVGPVLAEGIRQGGAKIINHRAHPDREFPAVHGREGEPCFVCGTTILKTRVGARGTYFCPRCQSVPSVGREAAG